MSEKNRGRILIIATALLWGLAGVCVKSITWGPLSIIAARSILSLIILFISKRNLHLRFSKQNLLAGLTTSITGILYVAAIKLTTAGTAIVLQYIAPILVLLFAVVFQKRKIKPLEIILTLAVFAGCVLSFADSLDFTHLLGNLLAVLSGFSFAAQIIFMNADGCDTDDATILSNMISLVIALPFVFGDSGLSFDAKNILWVLILGLFQYGLANLLFARGIHKLDKVEASLYLTIEPIFNPIMVAIVCGERMGVLALAGSVIVIVSVTLYSVLPALQQRRKSTAAEDTK